MHSIVYTLVILLTVFNFLYLVLLTVSPRELRDVSNNIDYFKIFGLALFGVLLLAALYAIVVAVLSAPWQKKKQ